LRVAAVPLLAAALVGCGTGADERFAERGNAICRDAKQQGTPAGEALRRLKALQPPAHLRAARDRFFADLTALARLAPVTGAADRAKAADLMTRLPDEARALGWTDCAG
jgi:hypothetical protein